MQAEIFATDEYAAQAAAKTIAAEARAAVAARGRYVMEYASVLARIAGSPPVLDLVHLGLGRDGHTASFVPGDPVLDVNDSDAALTGVYQGRRRMTLTYPIINRARRILWLVTGSEKSATLSRLEKGDQSIPAGRFVISKR